MPRKQTSEPLRDSRISQRLPLQDRCNRPKQAVIPLLEFS